MQLLDKIFSDTCMSMIVNINWIKYIPANRKNIQVQSKSWKNVTTKEHAQNQTRIKKWHAQM